MFLHPLQRETDVVEPGVQGSVLGDVVGCEETEGPEPVLHGDDDDAVVDGLADVREVDEVCPSCAVPAAVCMLSVAKNLETLQTRKRQNIRIKNITGSCLAPRGENTLRKRQSSSPRMVSVKFPTGIILCQWYQHSNSSNLEIKGKRQIRYSRRRR